VDKGGIAGPPQSCVDAEELGAVDSRDERRRAKHGSLRISLSRGGSEVHGDKSGAGKSLIVNRGRQKTKSV